MKNVLVLLLTLVYFTSCSPEVDFVEPFTSDEETENENNPEENPEEEIVVSTDPCDFTLENAEAGETIIIDCVMDLGGKTIDLPSDVTFEYDGGDIINGTLNFNNGVIDGRLLNSKLEIKGTARLLDATFEFNPKRWDIVEGRVSDEVALKNKDVIQELVDLTKQMKATIFKINHLDIYFYVGSRVVGSLVRGPGYTDARNALTIPGDFTFRMTDNTHIRVQPNPFVNYTLMGVTDGASNILIEGGNLYGDRDEHDYSSGGSHEWGHVFMIAGATNVTLRGITMKNGAGDGLDIKANVTSQLEGHISSTNILIQDCVFDSNRRNNISITDGNNITIDNNLVLNAGIDTDKSKGTAPRVGLDIEEVYFEEAYDITISNNTERGSSKTAFLIAVGYDVIIENNITENSISIGKGTGNIIRNNTLARNPNDEIGGIGIGSGRNDVIDNYNNKIYGNTITGFSTGIFLQGKIIEVFDNIITDCTTGIRQKGITDSFIRKNTIVSTIDSSNGITSSSWLNNVEITENKVDVQRKSFSFTDLNVNNEELSYTFLMQNNDFVSQGIPSFSNVNGLLFVDNNVSNGIEVFDSRNLDINSNSINSGNSHGIYLRKENFDISIQKNVFNITNSIYNCIEIQNTTNESQVNLVDNDCSL